MRLKMNLNYLYTPVKTIIEPPIDTNCQELPLEKLAWEDFEKLCLAIVQIEFTINDCEIYGVKGQAQEGIDIYARQSSGKYSSYQCKRYQEFDVDDLDKAVSYFKNKKFYAQSSMLYLCTSCEWNKTQVQDKFEKLKTDLEKDNIILIKWDKIQISRLLKTQPQIVYDFFGIEWVKKFNGELGLQQVSRSKKLDACQMRRYRIELYEFYSTIFNIQDPGIPIKELNAPYPIQDRFIIPDIHSNVRDQNFGEIGENSSITASSVVNLEQERFYYDNYWYGDSQIYVGQKKVISEEEIEDNSFDIRIKIDECLSESSKNIIIGDPGAGKSTLLRYIILDVLSETPQLNNISQKYGKLLPVWLPFAFITKQLTQNDTLSISEILNLWFKGFGKTHLFQLASVALEDERLFLIIDGVDEWTNISSAQQAITRIETIRELYDCQVLYSSRPYGFRLMKDFFTNLKVLNLAGFSNIQQKQFSENWYTKWASTLNKGVKDEEFAKRQSDLFIKELEQIGELKKLAETPLLLSVLITQKMRDSVLPKNKLEALKEITQYLITKHPSKRVSNAGIVQDKTIDIDFKDIFCELAIYIQRESNDGVILKSDACKVIAQYLVTYGDYDKATAKVRSQELIEVGANNFGIIVEKSNEEISFSHKQFQEFLAAQYLLDSDEESVEEFINKYAANPTFHQTIVNFFGLIPVKQVKRYRKCLAVLNDATREIYQEHYLKLICYEVTINLENAPSEILNNSFEAIIKEFEYETDPLFKEALLSRLLDALRNTRLKDRVEVFLVQYLPNQSKYRDRRVYSLRYVLRLNDQQIEFLQKAFINGTIEIRYDACYTLRKHITNKQVFEFVKAIIRDCTNPQILGFAINAVITNEIDQNEIDELLSLVETQSPIVQFFLYKYKVFTRTQKESDLANILSVVNKMSYHLRQESIDLLTDGYGKSEVLKEVAVRSVQKVKNTDEGDVFIEREIAWKLLTHCFNSDFKVIELVTKEFSEEFPFSAADQHNMFRYLIHYFENNEKIAAAVEKWISQRLVKNTFIDNDVAYASIFVHSDTAKDSLLTDLPKSGISHWNVLALLEGWGDDLEVRGKLKDYFRTVDVKKTSAAAHFISRVFDDKEKDEAIKILETILFDKDLMFRERAIPAFVELDTVYFEKNILTKLIEELDSFSKDIFGQYYITIEEIVKNFGSNPLVQSAVVELAKTDNKLYSLIVQYFPESLGKEDQSLKVSLPLPNELRMLIIERLSESKVFSKKITLALSNFDEEEDGEIKADMAISLFNNIKEIGADKIIELSKPLVFARGFDFEIRRNIAFTGYLISHRLEDYFLLEEEGTNKKPTPINIFTDYGYRRNNSGFMLKSLIDNFDYFISVVGKDFKSIMDNGISSGKKIEEIWSFFAQHSFKSSPSYTHIMEYISNNNEVIVDNGLISFLNRTSPKSSILKEILLKIIDDPIARNKALAGKILGTNFKDDNEVYKSVKKVEDYLDTGRIIALCNGWRDEPVLKEIFDEILKFDYRHVDDHVGFNLKFLFRDNDNLVGFLKDIFSDLERIKFYHNYFFLPMIERLNRDNKLVLEVKALLFSCTSISEKISYYNLLAQVNKVDEDVIIWKSKISDFKNDYGYDIVSNRTVRLKDILHDYYF